MRRNPLTHKRPEWLDRGVMLTGLQEPILFMKQRGIVPADAEKSHFALRSEAFVKQAKARGYNLIILSGQKGGGIKAEADDIRASKRIARMCHKHGIKVGTYIGDTLLTTTAFREMPESRDWVCINAYDRPVYYGTQVFRQKACRSNPGYLAFLKRAVKLCIEEIGTDLLHLDNFFRRPEPNRCRCRYCAEGFRNFARAKYTDEELYDRYGYTDLSDFGPPPIQPDVLDWQRGTVHEPWLQDWIEYNCVALADAYRELADYARGLKPDIAVELNPYGLDDRNTAQTLSVDHPRLLPHGDCFWSEEHHYAGVDEKGDMTTRVRSYKMARTLHQVLFTYVSPYRGDASAVLSVAEALAFNQQSLASMHAHEGRAGCFLQFRQSNEDLYLNTELIADASVLHNFETLAFHNWGPRITTRLAEQALIQSHIPFEIIFDRQFETSTPRVLVMPDVACVSDEVADVIRRRVEAGMGLVATGPTGTLTPWMRDRKGCVLGDLFGLRSRADATHGLPRRLEFGKGRVSYFPELPPSRPIDAPPDFHRINIQQLPANWQEFAEAVQWAAGEPSVELLAPKTVAAEFLRQGKRLIIHVVNYDSAHAGGNMELRIGRRLARGKKKARYLSPDEPDPKKLSITTERGSRVIPVPATDTYGVVVIE